MLTYHNLFRLVKWFACYLYSINWAKHVFEIFFFFLHMNKWQIKIMIWQVNIKVWQCKYYILKQFWKKIGLEAILDWLIDWLDGVYAVLAIFQPCNGGVFLGRTSQQVYRTNVLFNLDEYFHVNKKKKIIITNTKYIFIYIYLDNEPSFQFRWHSINCPKWNTKHSMKTSYELLFNSLIQLLFSSYCYDFLTLGYFGQHHLPRRWRSGLERWPRQRKVGCSNPSRDKPKS